MKNCTHKLIAFAGYNGAGKDTAASMFNYLVHTNGKGTYEQYKEAPTVKPFTILKFSHRVRQIACFITGDSYTKFLGEDTKSELMKGTDKTRRDLLQWIGEDLRNEFFGQDYWAKQTMEFFRLVDKDCLLTDLRNLAEAKAIKEEGGIIVMIKSDKSVSLGKSNREVQDILYDYLIDNTKDIEYLYSEVTSLYAALIGNGKE